MSNYYNMWDYSTETERDIRSEFGDSAISKISDRPSISESLAIYNAMTQEERDAILYLKDNNFTELQALYARVKERAGL